MRQQVASVVSAEPAFDKSKRAYMSRGQRLERGLMMTRKLFDLVDKEDWGYMEVSTFEQRPSKSCHKVH